MLLPIKGTDPTMTEDDIEEMYITRRNIVMSSYKGLSPGKMGDIEPEQLREEYKKIAGVAGKILVVKTTTCLLTTSSVSGRGGDWYDGWGFGHAQRRFAD